MFCLVHGLGVGQRYFDPLAAELGGAQLRPEQREPLPIEELAEQLAAQLAEPAVVVANSMGCQTAAELAIRRPDLVAALALVGPTVDPTARNGIRYAFRLARDAWFEPPGLTGIVVRDYLSYGPLRVLRQARYALAHELETRLPEIDVPTLVLRGAYDPVCPARWGREAAALLRTRLVTVAGAGHAVHYSHPRQVAQEVRRLLAETRVSIG